MTFRFVKVAIDLNMTNSEQVGKSVTDFLASAQKQKSYICNLPVVERNTDQA